MNIAEQKSALRIGIKERLLTMSAKDRDIESRVLSKELERMLGNTPKTIAGYMALSDEPAITPLLEKLMTNGWTIVLPVMEHQMLVFRTVRSFSNLQKGAIGVLEPTLDDPATDPKTIDVVIVPGRAFTKDGKRLGRGNGGYDRWISAVRPINPSIQYIGVCFECQVVGDIAYEAHDEKVHRVVTSRGALS